MISYLEIFPLFINILLFLYMPINNSSSKYLKERLNPSIESPIYWQLAKPSKSLKILELLNNLSLLIILLSAFVIGYKFYWWYSLLFLLHTLLIPSLLLGVIKIILYRMNPNYNFHKVSNVIGSTRIISIFLIDAVLIYFLMLKLL